MLTKKLYLITIISKAPSKASLETSHSHPLRPTLISQTLDWIQLLQRRIPRTIHKPKDKNKRNHRLRLSRTLNPRRLIRIILDLPRRILCEIRRHKRANDAEDDDEDGGRDEELWAAAPFVCVDGAEDGAGEGDDVLHAVVEETEVAVFDTCATEHGWVVVGDGAVAGPLAEEGHGEDEHGAVAGFARVEEFLRDMLVCLYTSETAVSKLRVPH